LCWDLISVLTKILCRRHYFFRGFRYTMEETITIQENDTYQSANIDQMTLELLMNKTQYQKYISKTNPKRYAEIQKYLASIQKYRGQIETMTETLLDNPEKPITTDVNEAFENYTRTLIKYFQMKNLEKKEDNDILFDTVDDDDTLPIGSLPGSSFWSKEKVIKVDAFSMDMFAKKNI